MSLLEQVLEDIGATDAGWEVEGGFGDDDNLIAPDGCMIEQDGRCPHGHVSPLRAAGLI